MDTMKAWQSVAFTQPVEKTLQLSASVPRPRPSPTEVIVRVHSTSLNPIDHKIMQLGFLSRMILTAPVTPGLDLCGAVVEAGSSATHFKPGDVVFGACNGPFGHGALADYVAVSQDTLALAPAGVTEADLAAIATVGMTSFQALKDFVKPRDSVFINGGSGGTGVLTIQIAKQLGCRVTASCSTGNVELCRSLGADEVLDYTEGDVVQQLLARSSPFDLVLDNVGNPSNLYRAAHGFLRPSGMFVQVGLGMDLAALRQFLGNVALGCLRGRSRYVFAVTKPNRADFEQLGAWMQEGRIRAVLDSVFEFGAVPDAFARLKTGRARGKVVVRVKGI